MSVKKLRKQLYRHLFAHPSGEPWLDAGNLKIIQNMFNINEQIISLKSINLITLNLPQKEKFISGIGVRNSRKALIVEWEDLNGVKGYGECSCRPDPYYSHEFTSAAISLVENFVIPFLKPEQTLDELLKILSKIRGWNFTKAAIEIAALQVIEQNTGSSPFENIKNSPLSEVPVGISMGLYDNLSDMQRVVENAISLGYKRLKFKISPAVHTSFFDSLFPLLTESGAHISFDANGSLDDADLETLAYFVHKFDAVIEQPFGTDRFELLLKAKKKLPNLRICFDEEIKSKGDLLKLQKLDVLDEVNLKVGRVGGIIKSIEIVEFCNQHKISCWIGGMFETGIGRITNLRVASYLGAASAHDLSPSDRYFLEDVIYPHIKMNNGLVDIESLNDCKINMPIIEKYSISNEKFVIAKSELTC